MRGDTLPTLISATLSGDPRLRHERLNRPVSRYWTCGGEGTTPKLAPHRARFSRTKPWQHHTVRPSFLATFLEPPTAALPPHQSHALQSITCNVLRHDTVHLAHATCDAFSAHLLEPVVHGQLRHQPVVDAVRLLGPLPQHVLQQQAVVLRHALAPVAVGGNLLAERDGRSERVKGRRPGATPYAQPKGRCLGTCNLKYPLSSASLLPVLSLTLCIMNVPGRPAGLALCSTYAT